jgi:hypothetical protein
MATLPVIPEQTVFLTAVLPEIMKKPYSNPGLFASLLPRLTRPVDTVRSPLV